MTVSTDLNIVISTLDSAPALYVDVPLTNIQNIRLEKKPASPESQELMWGIAIDLSSLDQSTFYVNAAGRSDAVITLAFDGQSSANGLKRIIEARILEHPTAQLLQRSLQGQSESDELSDPSSDKNYDSPHQSSQSRPQNLVVTALRASMSIPPAPEAEMNPSLRPQPEQKVVMRSTDNIEPYDINTQLSLQNTETSQPQSQRLEYGNSRGSQNYGLSNVASFKGASFRYQVDSNVLATPEGPTLLQQSLDPIVMSPSLVRDKSNDAARLLLSENPKSLGEEDLKHDVGMRNERYRSPGKDGAFRNIETEYMGTPNSEDGTHHGYDTSTRNGRDPSGNDDSDEISDKDYNQHEDEAENFAEPREFQITDQDLQHDQGTLKNEWKADERQVQKVPRAKLSRQLRDADGNSVDLATAATERPIGLSTQMNTPKVKSRAVAPGKQSEMTDLYRLGNRSAKDIEDEYRLPSSSPIRAPEKKSKAKVLSKTPRTKAAGKGVSAAPPTKKSSSKTANFRSKPAAKRAGAESKPTKNTSHENEVPLTLEVRGMENDDDHQNEGIQIEADKTKPVPQAIRPSIQQKNEPKKAPISKVPQKRQSNVPSTKPNSPGLASVEPRHNRPRRAAALTAKKKIRGLDMADDIVDDGDDHFIDQQLSASSQNLMPPPPNKSKAQDFTRPTPNEEKYSKSGLASKSPHPVSQRQVKKPFAMSEEHASSTRDDIVSGSSEKVMIIPSVQRTEKDDKRLPQITPLQKKDESTVRSQPPESPFWGQNVERAEKLLPEEITSSTNQIDDTTETTIEFGLDTLADCVSTASRHDKPQAAQGNVNKPSRIIENIGHAKRPIKPPLDAAEVSFPSNIGSKDLAKPVEQLEGDLKANSELESAENPPIIPNDPASLRRSLAKNIGDPSQLKDPFSEKLNRVVNQGQSHQHQHANTSTSQEKGTNPAEIRQRDELLDPASMQHGSSAIDPPLQTVDEDDTPFPLVLSPSHVPSVPPNGKRKTTTQPANTRSKRHKITSAEDAGIATVAATSHAGATTPLVGPTQKPELISFGASGPKNQGTISAKKVGIDAEFQALDAKARRSLNQATLKRRQQDIAASERVSRAPKRQQMSMINKNAENSNAVLQELDTAILSQKERKPSSQSTRVDENGSPIPFNSPRPDPFASQQSEKNDSKIKQMFSDAQLNEDDGYVVQGGGLGEIDHSLPFTHESLMPQARHVTFGRVSSNTKQAPSSPIAPSAFTLIPAHQIYSNGEVVDTKTRKPILPSNPQDPFLDFGRERKSDFMKKLRKASAFAPFRQNHASEKNATRKIEALKAGQHRSPARRVPVTEQDPEKTLIGTDRPTARKRHCEISNSSISSQTVYSEDAMGSGKISGNDSERGSLDEWHSALKPHQTNVLTMLLEIANVSHFNWINRMPG